MYELSNKIIHYVTLIVIQGIFFLCCPQFSYSETVNKIESIRSTDRKDNTRIVIETTKEPKYRIFQLHNPERIVVDFANSTRNKSDKPISSRLISKIRHSNNDSTLRIVFDTDHPVLIQNYFTIENSNSKPYRFVIDIAERSLIDKRESASNISKNPVEFIPVPVLKPRAKPVIVIDAGHGGHDPGSIGRHGTYEKNITLEYAKALKDALVSQGKYEVFMTRSDDRFIALNDRVKIAQESQGQLFISIHADSAENQSADGLSVYTLSEIGSDKEAEALANKENKSDIIAGVDLSSEEEEITGVLIDLLQRDSKNNSAYFAELLTEELGNTTRLRKNPHRFAGFRVLTGANLSSVLIELGYLSNQREEKLLNTDSHKKKLANSIVIAIDRYFEWYKAN